MQVKIPKTAAAWVIADTHFRHENVVKWTRGQFVDVTEMNEYIIKVWNERVAPDDVVFHLGDVVFGQDKVGWMDQHMPRLHGKKYLILGNHDEPKFFVGHPHFKKVMLWAKVGRYLMTHVPVHPCVLDEDRFEGQPMINVHGHIHDREIDDDRYICVSVEHTGLGPVKLRNLKGR